MKFKLEEGAIRRKGIFDRCVFALSPGGASYETKKDVRKKITSNDGVVSFIVTKKCHYLIVLNVDGASSSSDYHMKVARKHGIPAVSAEFIDACLSDNCVVPASPFLISSESSARKTLNDSFILGRISAVRDNDESVGKKTSGGKLKVWQYLDPAMPAFYTQSYALAKYTVFKSQSRMGDETTFATVEIHVRNTSENQDNDCIPKYCVFVYTGTTNKHDVKEPSRVCRFTSDSGTALDNYAKVLQTLTSPPRSMSTCSLSEGQVPLSVGSTELQKISESVAVTKEFFDPEIKELVGHMWKTTLGFVGITDKFDPTKFSMKDIDEAEKVLIEIIKMKCRGGSSEIQSRIDKYRALIPQPIEVDLTDSRNLVKQRHYLQLMRDIVGVSEANPVGIVGAYKALNCRISCVGKDSREYAALLKNMNKNGLPKVDVLNVFAVRRTIEDDNFTFSLTNKRFLFYGSTFENFVGILSRGLLPVREIPEISEANKMLGNGIYFTDAFMESVKYTDVSITRSSRFMIVAEVALGKCYETFTMMPKLTSAPEGFNSVHGVVESDFKENEFVVYNANQQRLMYVVEFRIQEDEISTATLKSEIDFDNLWTSPDLTRSQTTPISLEKIIAMKEEELGSVQWGLKNNAGKTIPFKGVHVRAQILDLASKVVIIQEYYNDLPVVLKEFEFTFPLQDETAVCGFEAFIGSKHVVGKVKEKQQAHAIYKEAVAKGHGGYLMDEQGPEMFKIMIGNLPPKTSVIIKITYVSELSTEGEHMSFRLPKGISREGKITESLEMGIEMPFVIRRISSPLNRLKIKKTDTMATVKLEEGETLGKGFELIIQLAEIHVPRMWVEDHSENSTQACMLTFYPTFDTESSESEGGSAIILLDASNSMRGDLFETAKIISLLCLHKIPSDWSFNVIVFGSVWEELFPICQPKSLINATAATEFIERAAADMGCTDVFLPLRSLFFLPPSEGRLQNVFLITDGHILNADILTNAVELNQMKTRIFTFGIGSPSSPCGKHLLKSVAYKASGAFEEFDSSMKSKWMRRVELQLQRAAQPVLTDITVEWQLFDAHAPKPVQSPIKFPPIFHGNRQIVYGFVSHCNLATLKAKIHGVEVSTVVSTSDLSKTKGKILHELTARALIRDWNEGLQEDDDAMEKVFKISKKSEIIELSEQYGVLSPLTSFVAIEVRDENEKGASTTGPLIRELLEKEVVDRLGYIKFDGEKEIEIDSGEMFERLDYEGMENDDEIKMFDELHASFYKTFPSQFLKQHGLSDLGQLVSEPSVINAGNAPIQQSPFLAEIWDLSEARSSVPMIRRPRGKSSNEPLRQQQQQSATLSQEISSEVVIPRSLMATTTIAHGHRTTDFEKSASRVYHSAVFKTSPPINLNSSNALFGSTRDRSSPANEPMSIPTASRVEPAPVPFRFSIPAPSTNTFKKMAHDPKGSLTFNSPTPNCAPRTRGFGSPASAVGAGGFSFGAPSGSFPPIHDLSSSNRFGHGASDVQTGGFLFGAPAVPPAPNYVPSTPNFVPTEMVVTDGFSFGTSAVPSIPSYAAMEIVETDGITSSEPDGPNIALSCPPDVAVACSYTGEDYSAEADERIRMFERDLLAASMEMDAEWPQRDTCMAESNSYESDSITDEVDVIDYSNSLITRKTSSPQKTEERTSFAAYNSPLSIRHEPHTHSVTAYLKDKKSEEKRMFERPAKKKKERARSVHRKTFIMDDDEELDCGMPEQPSLLKTLEDSWRGSKMTLNGPVPVCSGIKSLLTNDDCDILRDSVKSILKKGWGSSEASFKAFQESLLAEMAMMEWEGGNEMTTPAVWIKQQNDGAFDEIDSTARFFEVLDASGIQSLGTAVKSMVLRMCNTLEVLGETLLEEWFQDLIDILTADNSGLFVIHSLDTMRKCRPTLVVQIVMAIAYVIKVNEKYPVLFRTLQLKTPAYAQNWETFVSQFSAKLKWTVWTNYI